MKELSFCQISTVSGAFKLSDVSSLGNFKSFGDFLNWSIEKRIDPLSLTKDGVNIDVKSGLIEYCAQLSKGSGAFFDPKENATRLGWQW